MERLKLLINAINEVVSFELDGLVVLSGDKLEAFKKHARIDWDTDPIYYNMTALISTNPDDYANIKLIDGLEQSTRLEIPEYNYYIYIHRFHNNEFLLNLLKIEDKEATKSNTQQEEGDNT